MRRAVIVYAHHKDTNTHAQDMYVVWSRFGRKAAGDIRREGGRRTKNLGILI